MRFFLSLLGIVIFIVVVIVIIASHGSGKPAPKPINLDNFNTANSSVTQITTGELVGEESRQAVKVTVTQSARTIYLLSGYENNVSSSETFANTPAAYSAFLGALQNNGFAVSRPTTEANMFGVCPLGDTYQYELDNYTSTVSSLWSTSCSITDGTFNGYGSTIRQLFSLQIPNFLTYVQNESTISSF